MKKILSVALLLAALLVSCAPAATSSPVPTLDTVPLADESAVSPAVVTVDMFYTLINVAQSSDELSTPWYILTTEAQCNPIDNCEMVNFQTKWWESKALYRLYDCNENTVIAEEMLYPRSSNPPSAMSGAKYWAYSLIEDSGLLMISKIQASDAPGSECVLALDRVANP